MEKIVKIYRSRVVNVFGFQILRVIIARLLLHWRRLRLGRRLSTDTHRLIKDGYLEYDNFLPREVFLLVREEFNKAIRHPNFVKQQVDEAGLVLTTVTINAQTMPFFPKTTKHILQNEKLMNIILSYDGRRSLNEHQSKLVVAFWRIEEAQESHSNAPRNRYTNSEFHSDSFHSVLKGFLYLHDVKEDDGAHRYIPRSHRITALRIVLDYLNSILWLHDSTRVKNCLRDILCKDEIVFERPENSLIFEDTYGFHAASRPAQGRHRDIVYLHYRSEPLDPSC